MNMFQLIFENINVFVIKIKALNGNTISYESLTHIYTR